MLRSEEPVMRATTASRSRPLVDTEIGVSGRRPYVVRLCGLGIRDAPQGRPPEEAARVALGLSSWS